MEFLTASVAINRPILKTYDYIIPDDLKNTIKIGSIVKVSIKNQSVRGCVVDIKTTDSEQFGKSKLKPIEQILTPDYYISENLIKLGKWMNEYYHSFPGATYACISFIGLQDISAKTENVIRIKDPVLIEEQLEDISWEKITGKSDKNSKKFTKKEIMILDFFLENDNNTFSRTEIIEQTSVGLSVINKLIEKQILEVIQEVQQRHDPYTTPIQRTLPITLNQAQKDAFEKIQGAINDGKGKTFLIHGVTGSGKTEIYLQAIALCLSIKKQCIILVPEIALTPQTVERFRARFGDIVGVYHSKLTIGQKYDLYKKITDKKVSIVVGARSALFSPFDNLGLIIVDEEHERTFKQDKDPRYQSRDVAVMRGHMENAVVILGSATPSLESYYNALKGKYTLLTLPERVENIPLPPVSLIDMSKNIMESAEQDILSQELSSEIEKTINRNEQVILFINRRGFFNFFTCLKCHLMMKCKYCDVGLTYHQKPVDTLLCHLCGKKYNVPKNCPRCESDKILMIGAGIQRVEEELNRKFPNARVLRVDLDTTASRNSFIEKWHKIVNHEVDIILGTQMVAKGFHLEKVTLVGVVLADIGLHLPDFRATERTFSLIMQVAGRAGRGQKEGKVLIQTYHPEHYAFSWACEHNYIAFAQKELKIRSLIKFPPFCKLVSIIILGKNHDQVKKMSDRIAATFKDYLYKSQEKNVWVIGPAPSPIAKIRGNFRWRIILRGKDHPTIRKYITKFEEDFSKWQNKTTVRVIFDVDPFDLL